MFTRRQANKVDPGWQRPGSGLLISGIAALLLVVSAGDATPDAPPAQAPAVAAQHAANPAIRPVNTSPDYTASLAQLQTLPIKGRAPKTGYRRSEFGPAWTDDVNVAGGHNGCDTRNDILRRDLVDITLKPGSRACTVLSGTLNDPYSGKTIPFTRGAGTSAAVQIDHMVSLSDAWQKGAQQLDPSTRQDFANDPRNLQATSGELNKQKGDGDAATWLPPNRAYRCTFVSRQVQVKAAYGLWVTQAEHDVIAKLLTGCGATAPAGYRDHNGHAAGSAQAAAHTAPAAPR